jgi:hypothetical protein
MEDHMPRKSKSTSQEPPVDTSTVNAEPPTASQDVAPDSNDSQHSFVEQVGPRKGIAIPDPFSIAGDYLAGVRLFESKRDRQMAIKFGEGRPEDKPSHAIIGKLKEAGYHWSPTDRVWAHPIWPASAMSTRIKAEQLFQDICQTIRNEKGIDPSQEIPF